MTNYEKYRKSLEDANSSNTFSGVDSQKVVSRIDSSNQELVKFRTVKITIPMMACIMEEVFVILARIRRFGYGFGYSYYDPYFVDPYYYDPFYDPFWLVGYYNPFWYGPYWGWGWGYHGFYGGFHGYYGGTDFIEDYMVEDCMAIEVDLTIPMELLQLIIILLRNLNMATSQRNVTSVQHAFLYKRYFNRIKNVYSKLQQT